MMINVNDFIKNFAEQFEDTPASQFKIDTQFRDLDEWDSLHALAIMAMANEKYKVKITPEEIKNSKTLAEIYEVIKSKM